MVDKFKFEDYREILDNIQDYGDDFVMIIDGVVYDSSKERERKEVYNKMKTKN